MLNTEAALALRDLLGGTHLRVVSRAPSGVDVSSAAAATAASSSRQARASPGSERRRSMQRRTLAVSDSRFMTATRPVVPCDYRSVPAHDQLPLPAQVMGPSSASRGAAIGLENGPSDDKAQGARRSGSVEVSFVIFEKHNNRGPGTDIGYSQRYANEGGCEGCHGCRQDSSIKAILGIPLNETKRGPGRLSDAHGAALRLGLQPRLRSTALGSGKAAPGQML